MTEIDLDQEEINALLRDGNPIPRGYKQLRGDITVPPAGRISLQFEAVQSLEGVVLEARSFCVGCGESFEWNEKHSWYECPICEVEFTPKEAVLLATLANEALKRYQLQNQDRLRKPESTALVKVEPGKTEHKKWDWRRWFGLSKTSTSSKT